MKYKIKFDIEIVFKGVSATEKSRLIHEVYQYLGSKSYARGLESKHPNSIFCSMPVEPS